MMFSVSKKNFIASARPLEVPTIQDYPNPVSQLDIFWAIQMSQKQMTVQFTLISSVCPFRLDLRQKALISSGPWTTTFVTLARNAVKPLSPCSASLNTRRTKWHHFQALLSRFSSSPGTQLRNSSLFVSLLLLERSCYSLFHLPAVFHERIYLNYLTHHSWKKSTVNFFFLFFFFFGCAVWLVGSQFSSQRLNPDPSSESTES